MPNSVLESILLFLTLISLVQIAVFAAQLRHALINAPQLHVPASFVADGKLEEVTQVYSSNKISHSEDVLNDKLPSVSVIVPTYNEEINVRDCVISALESTALSSEKFELLIVDDQSTDRTMEIVKIVQQELGDPRLKILAGQSPPLNQKWIGKNWACTQAARLAKGEYLLFIDADVRLKSGGVEAALLEAEREKLGLLTCWDFVVCGCLAEWVIQPLICNTLLSSFNFASVNDSTTDMAFGMGPFMLFNRLAYEQIGGHQSVAAEVLEDSALAKLIKSNGLKLKAMLGPDLASIRMYRSWAGIWEGWTKNIYLLAQQDLGQILFLASKMFLGYTVPWLVLAAVFYKSSIIRLSTLDILEISLSLLAIILQWYTRKLGRWTYGEKSYVGSTRYWWLSALGGVIVALIALTSFIKTETGWGWTWRGKVLSKPI